MNQLENPPDYQNQHSTCRTPQTDPEANKGTSIINSQLDADGSQSVSSNLEDFPNIQHAPDDVPNRDSRALGNPISSYQKPIFMPIQQVAATVKDNMRNQPLVTWILPNLDSIGEPAITLPTIT